jgi:hypothetical protein
VGRLDAPLRGDYSYDRSRLDHVKRKLKAISKRTATLTLRAFRRRARQMRENLQHELLVNSKVVHKLNAAQDLVREPLISLYSLLSLFDTLF